MDREDGCICLPPGFRFHPMDDEIITHYLWEKTMNGSFSARAIAEVDLNRNEPWDLPGKAKMGENEWYFFCRRDRKYPTGTRTNRATGAGYWKATGKDKEIHKGRDNLVGMKKTLVFYMGRAPKGVKTDWVMHEYRLEGNSFYHNIPRSSQDEWVVCRLFHKNMEAKRSSDEANGVLGGADSFSVDAFFAEELLDSPTLPPLVDAPHFALSSQVRAVTIVPISNIDDRNANTNTAVPPAAAPHSSCFLSYHVPPPNSHFSPNMVVGHVNDSLLHERSGFEGQALSHRSFKVGASDENVCWDTDRKAEISSSKDDITGSRYCDDLENLWSC